MNAQLSVVPSADGAQLSATLAKLRAAQQARVPDYAQRLADLDRLRKVFKAHAQTLVEAMQADFGRRSWHESMLTDVRPVLDEIDHIRGHLRHWMQPTRVATSWLYWPARNEVQYQPLGVVGIIAPWNYPVLLAVMPLIAAIAAGNHVMLKPSEHTPRTSHALAELLAEAFPADRVATVLGGAEVAAEFAGLPFDHLFFTGSTQVGRLVMSAAAKNLTPVTLELGGKSPAIVASDFDIATAAARIGFGKWLNAGQTCIASDYVLLAGGRRDAFVEAMRDYVAKAYGSTVDSPDYTTVVNDRQFARLAGYVEDARQKGATIIELGASEPSRRVMAPTLLTGVTDDMKVMQDEIFGPLLPIIEVKDVDAAIAYVNDRPRPLALYHFDDDRRRTESVLTRTVSGGVTINDTLYHIAQENLPFGGVGPSGLGRYHARDGFLAFSHPKAVLRQARWPTTALMRPPYQNLANRLVAFLTR